MKSEENPQHDRSFLLFLVIISIAISSASLIITLLRYIGK